MVKIDNDIDCGNARKKAFLRDFNPDNPGNN